VLQVVAKVYVLQAGLTVLSGLQPGVKLLAPTWLVAATALSAVAFAAALLWPEGKHRTRRRHGFFT
jgi:hypothetical protein